MKNKVEPRLVNESYTPYVHCSPCILLPKETLRGLLGTVAESVFGRCAKEYALIEKNAEASNTSEADMSCSPQAVIMLLKQFTGRNRESDFKVIAVQYAYNFLYRELCNQIAAIISRTYIELGDGCELADDEALSMIRDLLLEFDGKIINRNRFKRITSPSKSGNRFGYVK